MVSFTRDLLCIPNPSWLFFLLHGVSTMVHLLIPQTRSLTLIPLFLYLKFSHDDQYICQSTDCFKSPWLQLIISTESALISFAREIHRCLMFNILLLVIFQTCARNTSSKPSTARSRRFCWPLNWSRWSSRSTTSDLRLTEIKSSFVIYPFSESLSTADRGKLLARNETKLWHSFGAAEPVLN